MKRASATAAGVFLGAVGAAAILTGTGSAPAASGGALAAITDNYVLDHRVNAIDGAEVDLNMYRGKVLVIVNTASRCGLTPQYEGLQKLYDEKKDRGLVVLGFPANDFRNQEPGTNQEIAEFCTTKFGVTFPMFEKIIVTGDQKHPLYAQLTGQAKPLGGEIAWNFTKFIVGRDGGVVARFEPRTTPSDPEFLKRIDELLGPPKGTDADKPRPAPVGS